MGELNVRLMKAKFEKEAGNDKGLARAIYDSEIQTIKKMQSLGTIVIICSIPLMLIMVGFIFIFVGLYVKSKASKLKAMLEQAYGEYLTDLS